MLKTGLKLWSTNDYYVKEAVRLYEHNFYDYIELYSAPDSYNACSSFWEALEIPFIIHAPHYYGGVNLADRNNLENNRVLADEARKYADKLKAKYIIFHPGVGGTLDEVVSQLKKIDDERIIIENKPYYSVDKSFTCNGYAPEQIKYILSESKCGFCLDVGHSVFAANAMNRQPLDYFKEFLTFDPVVVHLSDGNINGDTDQHLHYGYGTFPIADIINLLPDDISLTIETIKDSKDSLDDFAADTTILQEIISGYTVKLANLTDMDDIYNLANDPYVRQFAFNQNQIKYEDHIKWFKTKLNIDDCTFYIARSPSNELIGYVRFDKNADSINEFIISTALTSNFRGKGIGSHLLSLVSKKFILANPSIKIIALIKKCNNISLKSFYKAGYKDYDTLMYNDEECYRLFFS